MDGRCAVVICPDDIDLTTAHLDRQLTVPSGTARAAFAVVPVVMGLPD